MPQPDDAIIRKTRLLPLVSLKDHPRNYRTHPEDQLAHLVASIEAHGLYRNIVVAKDLTILAGHGMAAAARKVGLKSVPCAVLDLDPMEPRALKVLAGDNGVQHLAEDDDRALADLLRQIKDEDETGLLGTGYDEAMLAMLAMVTKPASEIADFTAAAEWAGMPAYEPQPEWSLTLRFHSEDDRDGAARLLALSVSAYQKSYWWPAKDA